MGKFKRSQKSQRKQTRHDAHKRIPPNFHRFIWNGTRFASKLEISWAHFLNGLKIKWEYESKSVFLYKGTQDVTGYIPDFWLPELKMFLEVKGRVLLPRSIERMEATALETGHPVLLVQGSPSRALNPKAPNTGILVITGKPFAQWQSVDIFHCPKCQTVRFHQINNRESALGALKSCPHQNDEDWRMSHSILTNIAGRRIAETSIHIISSKEHLT